MYRNKFAIDKTYKWAAKEREAIKDVIAKLPAHAVKVQFLGSGTGAGSVQVIFPEVRSRLGKPSDAAVALERSIDQSIDQLKIAYPKAWFSYGWSRGVGHGSMVRFYPNGTPVFSIRATELGNALIGEVAWRLGESVFTMETITSPWVVIRRLHQTAKQIERASEIKIVFTREDLHVVWPQIIERMQFAHSQYRKQVSTGVINGHVYNSGKFKYEVELYGNRSDSLVQREKLETNDVIEAANRIADWKAQGHRFADRSTPHVGSIADIMTEAYTITINEMAAKGLRISK